MANIIKKMPGQLTERPKVFYWYSSTQYVAAGAAWDNYLIFTVPRGFKFHADGIGIVWEGRCDCNGPNFTTDIVAVVNPATRQRFRLQIANKINPYLEIYPWISWNPVSGVSVQKCRFVALQNEDIRLKYEPPAGLIALADILIRLDGWLEALDPIETVEITNKDMDSIGLGSAVLSQEREIGEPNED